MVEIAIGVVVTIVLGFFGWLALEVVEMRRKIAELEIRVTNQEKTCGERLAWMQRIDEKVSQIAVDAAHIRGKLGE